MSATCVGRNILHHPNTSGTHAVRRHCRSHANTGCAGRSLKVTR